MAPIRHRRPSPSWEVIDRGYLLSNQQVSPIADNVISVVSLATYSLPDLLPDGLI